MNNSICLLTPEEQALRIAKIAPECATLIADNTNIFYLTGRIFAGYILLMPGKAPRYFVKRPTVLTGENITLIRKPEDILAHLDAAPEQIGVETNALTYADVVRLQKAFGNATIVDASAKLMAARAVKTPREIELLRIDGIKQAAVYARIPQLFRQGMTDIELQAAIEYDSRLAGCLGIFRVNGTAMEIHMGSVLTGENSDAPSPYDFAMGGAGIDPSLPIGASGETIARNSGVMVDMNGCFNGYMTDCTRMFANGTLPAEAMAAIDCSRTICRTLAEIGCPGTEAKFLYEEALRIANEFGLAQYFMGHRQQAGFVGHGVGIQVNELPVLAPRSKAILTEGNVIAIEPKFVIPGFGAAGIENTYVCTAGGLECITPAPEEVISLI